MTEHVQHVREVRSVDERTSPMGTAARLIWFIADILLLLLALRFVFALLGANPANPFAHFIYTASYPFVAPFFGLFGFNFQYGVTKFEFFTLVAMAIYALIATVIVRLITIDRPEAY